MTEPRKYRVVVCQGPECRERQGSLALDRAFREVLRENRLDERVELLSQSCFGRCSHGPNVQVMLAPAKNVFLFATMPPSREQNAALYHGVKVTDVPRIVGEHIVRGNIVRDKVLGPEQACHPGGKAK
ncbi:MAG: (2Fe-2S) ferredoxin domain-containing protein [Deltaproteobacteria bacterium]|nr:(2Fe-2S) ferredoxin domain-containing protein [Deltaproteobacteria bacterium]